MLLLHRSLSLILAVLALHALGSPAGSKSSSVSAKTASAASVPSASASGNAKLSYADPKDWCKKFQALLNGKSSGAAKRKKQSPSPKSTTSSSSSTKRAAPTGRALSPRAPTVISVNSDRTRKRETLTLVPFDSYEGANSVGVKYVTAASWDSTRACSESNPYVYKEMTAAQSNQSPLEAQALHSLGQYYDSGTVRSNGNKYLVMMRVPRVDIRATQAFDKARRDHKIPEFEETVKDVIWDAIYDDYVKSGKQYVHLDPQSGNVLFRERKNSKGKWVISKAFLLDWGKVKKTTSQLSAQQLSDEYSHVVDEFEL